MFRDLPKKGVNGHHQFSHVSSTNQCPESCLRVCHYVKSGNRSTMFVEDVHELKADGDGFKFHHRAGMKSRGSSRGHKIMLIGPSGKKGAAPAPPLVIDLSMKIQAASLAEFWRS